MVLAAAVAFAIEPASPDYPGHCQAPKWSPDGRWLSWEVNYLERQAIELYVTVAGSAQPPRKVSPSTAGSSPVTAGFGGGGPSRAVVHELTFSPAALNRFVYASSGSGEDYDLYLDGSGALVAGPGADGNPAWSPDGRSVVFTSARTGQGDLYLQALGVAGAQPLRLSGDATASEVYAAWAPDSKRLAFVGHSPRGDNLFLIDDVGFPAPRAFTSWPGVQTRPSWSPDGTRIAFYANRDVDDRFDLYVIPAAGGDAARVATGVVLNPRGPSWTPDGASLVYTRADDATFNPVWRVPVADPGKARMVPTGTVGNTDLDVVRRPDGKTWLAVAAQGRVGDAVRDFRRIYTMILE